MNRNVALFAALLVGTLGTMAGARVWRSYSGPTEAGKREIPAPSTVVSQESVERLAGNIAAAALDGWTRAGVTARRAELLKSDVAVLLRSYLSDDFDVYRGLMHTKAVHIKADSLDGAVRYAMQTTLYEDVDKTRFAELPREDQMKFLWEHPDRRNVKLKRVGPDHVTAGVGWEMTTWNGLAFTGQVSLWTKDDDWTLIKAAMGGKAPAAYVELPVGFANGRISLLRLTFVFDEGAEIWLPARIDISGSGPDLPVPLI